MLLPALVLGATTATAALDPTAFVQATPHGFAVAGRPVGFVGANVSVIHGDVPRASADATLDAVQKDGLSVIRVWAMGEGPANGPDWQRTHAFRLGETGWLETSFAHLDHVLAGARARGVRVILVLANRWSAYGGVPELLRFAGQPIAGAEATAAELDGFFACAPCVELWRAHARRLLERTNTVTGVRYVDDPTILGWELMNEASAPAGAAADRLVAWIDAQAAFVRALAPRQLVSAGHVGYLERGDRRVWRRVCALPGIDYCDSHAYPEQDARLLVPADLRRWIADRAKIARTLGKPLVFGEVGVRTERPRWRGLTAAAWYDAFLRAAHAEGVAGTLAWIVEPWSGAARDFGIYVEDVGGARTGPVHQVLARWAARARTPPAPPLKSTAPWFRPGPTLRGPGQLHDRWTRLPGRALLAIDPLTFTRARFEAAGVWRDGALAHLYGAGPGWVEYTIATPRDLGALGAIRLRARVSSELPGAGAGATAAEGARVVVTIDGVDAGMIDAPPDDGWGAERSLTLAPAAAARLARAGRHVLRLASLEEPGASGLCVYAGATGRWTIPPAIAGELPGRIVLEADRL